MAARAYLMFLSVIPLIAFVQEVNERAGDTYPFSKFERVDFLGAYVRERWGSMPFPVEIDFSTNMMIGGRTTRF